MSHEDDEPKGSDAIERREVIIDPVTKEWMLIRDGMGLMNRANVPTELSRLRNKVADATGDFRKGKNKAPIIITIGTPHPDEIKEIAQSDRSKLPVLREAVFEQTIGHVMVTQELRFNTAIIEDIGANTKIEQYDAVRVKVRVPDPDREERDLPASFAVSYVTKSLDDPREWSQDAETIPSSALQENPDAVAATVAAYFYTHAPLEVGVR